MGKTTVANLNPDGDAVGEAVEAFRDNVDALTKAMEHFIAGGLNRKALITLLHDKTKVAKRTISLILDGIENMPDDYFDPPGAEYGDVAEGCMQGTGDDD